MVLLGKQARVKELLNEEGTQLQGESSGGILWSKDDAFVKVMGRERSIVFFFGYFIRMLLSDLNIMPLLYSG